MSTGHSGAYFLMAEARTVIDDGDEESYPSHLSCPTYKLRVGERGQLFSR